MIEDHKPNPDRDGFGTQADLISNAISYLTSAARGAAERMIRDKARLTRASDEAVMSEMAEAANVIGQASVLLGSLFKNLERIAGGLERIADDLAVPDSVMTAEQEADAFLAQLGALGRGEPI